MWKLKHQLVTQPPKDDIHFELVREQVFQLAKDKTALLKIGAVMNYSAPTTVWSFIAVNLGYERLKDEYLVKTILDDFVNTSIIRKENVPFFGLDCFYYGDMNETNRNVILSQLDQHERFDIEYECDVAKDVCGSNMLRFEGEGDVA